MDKLSLIVPHMPLPRTDEALEQMLASVKGEYDELILVVNDGIGYGRAVNLGLKWASGDYLIVSNNDLVVTEGTLRDMPSPDGVSVPGVITPRPRDYEPRCFFCLPRWVYEKIGGFDERFEGGYFEDDDMIRRLRVAGVPTVLIDNVAIHHQGGGGMTMKQIGEREHFERNQAVFRTIWGDN